MADIVGNGGALLEVADLSVEFDTAGTVTRVVDGIGFSIAPGERVGLVGESGSGKTVSALAIMRLNDEARVRYPTGSIRYAGRDLLRAPESDLLSIRGREIAMIFQEPMTSLNSLYTIGDQLVEPLALHLGMSPQAARERAVELLGLTGIPEPASRFDAYPHMLSGGQRQRVMIAMALACRPKLLIADEPTTALDVTIQAQIIELLESLQREFGMALLVISHDLNLVRRAADRVAVMQRGRIVEQGAIADVFGAPRHDYTKQLLASEPKPLAAPPSNGPELLSGKSLRVAFPVKTGWMRRTTGTIKAVDDVDVALRVGETLGVVGESGSGKTTLGMCLMRLQSCQGQIRFDGRDIVAMAPRELRPLRREMQIVFQDPYSSLSPRMTIEEIVGEGLRVHAPDLSVEQRRGRIVSILEEVGLDAGALWRYPHEFSGGQRQRIAIARAVILEPKLVLLDEPTSALDVSVQKQVLELLRELQQRHGLSYVFISHDLRVIRAMAHRVIVMRAGKVVEQGETEALFASPGDPYTKTLLHASLFAA